MRALSIDDTESVRHESPQAQNEPLLDDIGVTGGPSVTSKRTRALSVDAIISLVEVLDLMPQPNLEESCLTKRRRLAKRWAESLTLDPVSTPKSTPLQPPAAKFPFRELATVLALVFWAVTKKAMMLAPQAYP